MTLKILIKYKIVFETLPSSPKNETTLPLEKKKYCHTVPYIFLDQSSADNFRIVYSTVHSLASDQWQFIF